MLVWLKENEDFNRGHTKWQWAKRKAHRVSSKRKSRVDINLYGFQFLILLKCWVADLKKTNLYFCFRKMFWFSVFKWKIFLMSPPPADTRISVFSVLELRWRLKSAENKAHRKKIHLKPKKAVSDSEMSNFALFVLFYIILIFGF